MVEAGYSRYMIFTYPVGFCKNGSGGKGPVGGAAYKGVYLHFALQQALGHHGRVTKAALVERTFKISKAGMIPTALGMTYQQQ